MDPFEVEGFHKVEGTDVRCQNLKPTIPIWFFSLQACMAVLDESRPRHTGDCIGLQE